MSFVEFRFLWFFLVVLIVYWTMRNNTARKVWLGLPASVNTLNIILPVGISFYTFHSMSYTIDVYRGKQRPISNFVDLSLFVSFFPPLVAGPIVRAVYFLPQLVSAKKFSNV